MTVPVAPGSAVPSSHPEAIRGTAVGSYFVSNYPPYSFWKAERVDEALSALDRAPRPTTPLGLYLHIPFCRTRCKFCYFRVYTEKNAREVEDYLDALAREVELLAERAAVRGRSLDFVYFGGGTPSYLSTAQLAALEARLKAALSWTRVREVTFECEPGTITRKKLEAVRALGTTRLSFGVESFDDRVLELNGRAHRSAEIVRAWREARDVGFPAVNLDLIAGMVGETDETWRAGVSKTIELGPESVTIYQMELPYNTLFSKEILQGAQSPVASWETKRAWTAEAFEALERAGYRVSSGYTLVRADRPASFLYRDQLWRGADLLGAGVASFSHVGGVHFQNLDRFEEYITSTRTGTLPIQRAYALRSGERLIREMILQLKLGRIDAAYFRDKFGVEILVEFAAAFGAHEASGLLRREGDTVVLTRAGLLQVDGLLPAFFLPEHRGARAT